MKNWSQIDFTSRRCSGTIASLLVPAGPAFPYGAWLWQGPGRLGGSEGAAYTQALGVWGAAQRAAFSAEQGQTVLETSGYCPLTSLMLLISGPLACPGHSSVLASRRRAIQFQVSRLAPQPHTRSTPGLSFPQPPYLKWHVPAQKTELLLCPRLSDGLSVHGPQHAAGPTHSLSPTCLPPDRPPASQVKVEALASHCLGHSSQSSLKTAPGLVPKLHGDQPALGTQQVAPDATWVGGNQYPRPHQLQDWHTPSPQGTGPCSTGLITSPRERTLWPEGGSRWSNQEALHLKTAPKRISQS